MGSVEPGDGGTSLALLDQARAGDGPAATALFGRYFARLAALARRRFPASLARRVDPEDVAQSTLRTFFAHAGRGEYALSRVGDLWRLLSAIAVRKLLRQHRYHRAARRSVAAEVPLDGVAIAARPAGQSAALADDLDRIAAQLDPFGRLVLQLRGEGWEVAEIAGRAGRSERSVRRALARIRDLMAVEPGGDADLPRLSHRDYLLTRLIGAGRTGKVYRARALRGGGEVAVKFLRKPLLADPEVVRRFLAEARIVAGLRHPNIAAVRGLGRTGGGSLFLVMELVEGGDLAGLVGPGRWVDAGRAVAWGIQACDALDLAHRRGVIHCDLKPANLLLDGSGRIKVADFGLARTLGGGLARPGAIEGTAPFMAPEQVDRSWGRIDARTDVYGLGAVLFTLLAGQPPFPGARVADILAGVAGPSPAPSVARLRPDLPAALVAACRRCLAKRPEDRYPDVAALRADLAAIRA